MSRESESRGSSPLPRSGGGASRRSLRAGEACERRGLALCLPSVSPPLGGVPQRPPPPPSAAPPQEGRKRATYSQVSPLARSFTLGGGSPTTRPMGRTSTTRPSPICVCQVGDSCPLDERGYDHQEHHTDEGADDERCDGCKTSIEGAEPPRGLRPPGRRGTAARSFVLRARSCR